MAGEVPRLILVTGWTGAGKSTLSDGLAQEFGATVASFDWLMSGLRAMDEIWDVVELPPERQRRVGWNLMSRVAEQQLRRGSSCVLDLVARDEPRFEWMALADRYEARFHVIECVCSDKALHQARTKGRERSIPGWYELSWERVAAGREHYEPLSGPKLVLDAVAPAESNLSAAIEWLNQSPK